MTSLTASKNVYLAAENAESGLTTAQLPQFATLGQAILSNMDKAVQQLQSEMNQPSPQPANEAISHLTSQIESLREVFTQLPTVAQQLSRAHSLLLAQREAAMDGILVVDECDRIISINQKFCDFWKIPPELTEVRDDHKMLSHTIGQLSNPEQFTAKVQYLDEHPTESSHDKLLLKDGRIGDRYSVPVISASGEYFGRVWYFRDITARKRHEPALEQINETPEASVQERTIALQDGTVKDDIIKNSSEKDGIVKNSSEKDIIDKLQTTQTQLIQSEKMAALGNLVSGIAHEVNNPIGFITGNIKPALNYITDLFELIDLYEEQTETPNAEIEERIEDIDLDYIREDLPKLISSIQSGAKRVASISHSLRTFSRADTDTPVAFDIHDGLKSTLLILKHRLKATDDRPGIVINQHYSDLPPIECYAGQLNQVFMNLLANAIDALEESLEQGEIASDTPAAIDIHTQLLDTTDIPQVEITIRDNGIGMSQAVQEKIFEHLFTTKPVGQGTGLGLAIARQIIIDKHHGNISVESQIGEGTAFIITLPVTAQS